MLARSVMRVAEATHLYSHSFLPLVSGFDTNFNIFKEEWLHMDLLVKFP